MAIKQAAQGTDALALLDSLQVYLVALSGLQDRFVVQWHNETRPSIEGRDTYLWYAMTEEVPDKSVGPGRYGNRVNPGVMIHLVTRNMSDGSQRDDRRFRSHFVLRWRVIQAFQNLNLFSKYAPQPILQPKQVWQPPQPSNDATALTLEPMYLDAVPPLSKQDQDEATMVSSFRVILPTVLLLTLD
jgi:hypothetical protein